MSMIYFNDGGVYDPVHNISVTSVYVIDPEMLLPWKKIALPLNPSLAAAASFDGSLYAFGHDANTSTATVVNTVTGEIASTPYNLSGGQTKGVGFGLNADLHIGSNPGITKIAPPYAVAVVSALPIGIQAFSVLPSGAKAIIVDFDSQAYVYDLTTLALGSPISLLVDGSEGVMPTSLQVSPDGSKFLLGSFFDEGKAFMVFNAVTGSYLGRTGISTDFVGMFLADSKRIAYRGSEYSTLQVFDLATQSAASISLGVLDNDPPFSYGGDFTLEGMSDNDYAVMNNYGSIRLISTADGSVRATPRPNIKANGFATVQPLPAGPAPQVLTYFWSGFEKAYENPVVS